MFVKVAFIILAILVLVVPMTMLMAAVTTTNAACVLQIDTESRRGR